jgi:hypothetical protein
MISWFKRKEINSTEYSNLHKRVTHVELELEKLELSLDNIRNMARKIQKAREIKEEPEDLSSQVLVPV